MEQQPAPEDSHLRMVERLARSRGSHIKRYLRRKLPSLEEIKDASQEIWERLLRLPKEPIQDEERVLHAVARNVMRERVRANARNMKRTALPTAPSAEDDADPHTDSDDPVSLLRSPQPSLEEAEDERRARQLIREALDSLSVLHRAVYTRRDIDGLSVPDTARACGVSNTKAERLLTEARARMLDFITSRKKDFL